MRASDLAGRRVALYGYGRDTRSAHRFLRRRLGDQPLVLLVDGQPPDDVDPGLEVVSGPAARETVQRGEVDVVIRSPGVSIRTGPLAEVPDGVTVITSLHLLFGEDPTVEVVGVTGTKGKSSTSAMLTHLLAGAGRRVELAGNIGTPALDVVPRLGDLDQLVLELSSYQLADLEGDVSVGVFLNLHPEHLDWHGGFDAYRRDKGRICRLSRRLVASADDPEVAALAAPFRPRWWSVTDTGVRVGDEMLARETVTEPLRRAGLPGQHQVRNAAAALTAAAELGLDPTELAARLENAPHLPHRLQTVSDRGGVRWVDDSISTVPESAMAAVDVFDGTPITLILGGHDRGQDHRRLAERIAASTVETVIAIPDTGPRVADAVRSRGGTRVIEAADLEEAVTRAAACTPDGGVVLLSPAAPSYGRFRDFEERGERFTELVAGLS